MPKYKMFRHRARPGLRCIVALAQPLPRVLAAHMWEEEAADLDEQSAPPGFREGAARYALAMQGFYILRQPKNRHELVKAETKDLEM